MPDTAQPASGPAQAPQPTLAAGQIPHPVTGQPTTWDDVLLEYTTARREQKDLEDAAKALKRTADSLHDTVLEGFLQRQWKTGPQISGVGTPYLHSEGYPKQIRLDGETDEQFKERAIAALDQAGLEDKAPRGWNHKTLQSLFRSFEEEGIEPPRELLDCWEWDKKRDVRVRRPTAQAAK